MQNKPRPELEQIASIAMDEANAELEDYLVERFTQAFERGALKEIGLNAMAKAAAGIQSRSTNRARGLNAPAIDVNVHHTL